MMVASVDNVDWNYESAEIMSTNRRMESPRWKLDYATGSFSSNVSAITLDNELGSDTESTQEQIRSVPLAPTSTSKSVKQSERSRRRMSKERFVAEGAKRDPRLSPLKVPLRRFSLSMCQALGIGCNKSGNEIGNSKAKPKSKAPPTMPLRKESFNQS